MEKKLKDDNRAPETVGDETADNEILEDVLTSLEIRLHKSNATLEELELLDEELRQKEKGVLINFSKAKINLAAAVANNTRGDTDSEIAGTLKACLTAQPYVPDLESSNVQSEKLHSALENLYISSVLSVEQKLKDEEDPANPKLEQEFIRGEHEQACAISRLHSAKTWLKSLNSQSNLEDIPEMLSAEEIYLITARNKLRGREMKALQKKLGTYTYLQSALRLNRDVLTDALLTTIISQCFVEDKVNQAKMLSSLVSKFVNMVSHEVWSLEQLIQQSTDGGDNLAVKQSNDWSPDYHSENALATCTNVIKSLSEELIYNYEFRNQLGKLLSYLRCGPTSRLYLIPTDLTKQLNKCQNLREKFQKELRTLAGSYAELKKVPRSNPQASQQALWTYFLTDPRKLPGPYPSFNGNETTFRFKQEDTTFDFKGDALKKMNGGDTLLLINCPVTKLNPYEPQHPYHVRFLPIGSVHSINGLLTKTLS